MVSILLIAFISWNHRTVTPDEEHETHFSASLHNIYKLHFTGGGTGFIGSHLTKVLTASGYDTITLSRMPGLKRITWHELEENGLPSNTCAAINCAGQNVLDPLRRWSPGFKQNVWNSRVNTSKTLAKIVAEAKEKPKVFINVSGVSLYKPSETKVYTEDDAGENYDFMSNLCLHWEKAAELPTCETRQVRIRTGVVIGRDGGIIKQIKLPFSLGLGGNLGNGKQPFPWIHVEDLCNLIKFAIEQPNVDGPLNAVAPDIITNEQFTKEFSKQLRRPAIFAMPEVVIKTIFGEERAALLLTGAKIQPKRPLELNFKFQFPTVVEACSEVLRRK